jgi:hypothetical protein
MPIPPPLLSINVLAKKFPPSLIIDRINAYIGKLAMDKDNVDEVKRSMMNLLFQDLNILMTKSQIKYKFLIELLNSQEIAGIVNSMDRNLFINGSNLSGQLYQKLFPSSTSIAQYGGETDVVEPCTNEVMYEKISRLMDVSLPDSKVMELFVKYIENFLKNDSPEKTLIIKKIMSQLNVFIDQIFQSPEFRQPQFQKYLFYALLTDGNTIGIVSQYMRENSTSNATNAQLIQEALKKKMAELQTPMVAVSQRPAATTQLPINKVGGKRHSKLSKHSKVSKRTRKHHRKNNKSRKISKKHNTQNK